MFTNSLVAHSNTSRDTGMEKREKYKPWRDWTEKAIFCTGRREVLLEIRRENKTVCKW
jgi:hypothetical protein